MNSKRLPMKTTLPIVLSALFLAGCTTSYPPDIQTYRNPFKGTRTDLIAENLLEAKDQDRDLVYLGASRSFNEANECEYYLDLTYATTTDLGYLDIGRGASLVVVADGKEMQFSGSGSANLRKKKGALLNESAIYHVQPKDLIAIGNARQAKARIVGKARMVEREFSTLNLARFKKFADEFVSTGP
jgi:hypothetical protein